MNVGIRQACQVHYLELAVVPVLVDAIDEELAALVSHVGAGEVERRSKTVRRRRVWTVG